MQDGYTQTAPPYAHRNLRLPGVSDGVVGLHGREVRGAIIPEKAWILMNQKQLFDGSMLSYMLWKLKLLIQDISWSNAQLRESYKWKDNDNLTLLSLPSTQNYNNLNLR